MNNNKNKIGQVLYPKQTQFIKNNHKKKMVPIKSRFKNLLIHQLHKLDYLKLRMNKLFINLKQIQF